MYVTFEVSGWRPSYEILVFDYGAILPKEDNLRLGTNVVENIYKLNTFVARSYMFLFGKSFLEP